MKTSWRLTEQDVAYAPEPLLNGLVAEPGRLGHLGRAARESSPADSADHEIDQGHRSGGDRRDDRIDGEKQQGDAQGNDRRRDALHEREQDAEDHGVDLLNSGQ